MTILEQLNHLAAQEDTAMALLETAIEQQELRVQAYQQERSARQRPCSPAAAQPADSQLRQLQQQLQALEDQREAVHAAFRRRHQRLGEQVASQLRALRSTS